MRTPELSVSFAGVRDEPRDAMVRAKALGMRAVQLDAARPGTRPRDLDRSARRDLAARLRREELILSGLDLWIPEEHLVSGEHLTRAIEALDAAVVLAADLAELMGLGSGIDSIAARRLSVSLPQEVALEVVDRLKSVADTHGVSVADHKYPDPLLDHPIGMGLDPAGVAGNNADPITVAVEHAKSLVSARLSDLSNFGRTAPGGRNGRLDVAGYAAALTTAGHERPVVLDLRGLSEPWDAVTTARDAWASGALRES